MTAALCVRRLRKQHTGCAIKSAGQCQYVSGGAHDQLSGASRHGHVQMLGCHHLGFQNHCHVGLQPLEQECATHALARLSSTGMTLPLADPQRGGIQACRIAMSRLQRGLAAVQQLRSLNASLGARLRAIRKRCASTRLGELAKATAADLMGDGGTCGRPKRRTRIYSSPSPRCRNMQRAGCGHTITNGQTWPFEASPQNRSWPSWPDLYFWRALKMGGITGPEHEGREVVWQTQCVQEADRL